MTGRHDRTKPPRTLRDDLASVLGPGNDDATAYAQADNVLEVIAEYQDASALARLELERRKS